MAKKWSGDGGHVTRDAEEIFQGAHIPDQPAVISEEVRLWRAVIARCWLDAFEASDAWLKNTDRTADPAMVRQEARRWLVTNLEPWRCDRESVCDLADISERMLHRAAKRRLAIAKRSEAEGHTAKVVEIDRAFSKLLEDADGMEPADIDQALEALSELETAA